jgi:hypothetical protein
VKITYTLGDGIDRHMEVDDDSEIARIIMGDLGPYSIAEPEPIEEPPNLVPVYCGIDRLEGVRDSDGEWVVDAFGNLTDYGKQLLGEWPEHPALAPYVKAKKPVKYYVDGFVFDEKGEVVNTYEQEA